MITITNATTSKLKILALAIFVLGFAWGCKGGGDKGDDACDKMADKIEECAGDHADEIADFVDSIAEDCKNDLMDEADEAGGDECVDAAITVVDCLTDLSCGQLEEAFADGLDVPDECAGDVEDLESTCDIIFDDEEVVDG